MMTKNEVNDVVQKQTQSQTQSQTQTQPAAGFGLPAWLPWLLILCAVLLQAQYAQEQPQPQPQPQPQTALNDVAVKPNEKAGTDVDAETSCQCAPASAVKPLWHLSENVSDCCCSSHAMDRANMHVIYPLLKSVVQTPFFGHFKIDLCSDCELWQDAPVCKLRDCGVCECDTPPTWAADAAVGCDNQKNDQVDMTVLPGIVSGWGARSTETSTGAGTGKATFLTSSASEQPEPEDAGNHVVVDLRRNPERYTGYGGESAAKVWRAIHNENCFQAGAKEEHAGGADDDDSICLLPAEQRVYNRMLSGIHSSISLHIAHDFCLRLDESTIGECAEWGEYRCYVRGAARVDVRVRVRVRVCAPLPTSSKQSLGLPSSYSSHALLHHGSWGCGRHTGSAASVARVDVRVRVRVCAPLPTSSKQSLGLPSSYSSHTLLRMHHGSGGCGRHTGSAASVARERVLDQPKRLENLYVAFAVMLRAVVKAGPAIAAVRDVIL